MIKKWGNVLQIVPALTELTSDLTFARRMQRGPRPEDAYYETVRLYTIERFKDTAIEYMRAPAGLYSRITRAMQARNIPYTFEDCAPVELGEPQWQLMDEPRPAQDVIIAKIASSMHGQIEAPTGDGKSWLIVQVCKVYPKARVIIVVPGIGEAKNLLDRLLSVFPRPLIGQLGGGRREQDRRITVCVRNSLMKTDPAKCDILMYDECHTAGSDWTSKALARYVNCKMFGFSASTGMRTDKADMMVEALFGPVIHVRTYQESQDQGNVVPINVVIRAVPAGPKITSSNSVVINRHGVWRNDIRNALIAEDARKYAADGTQVLVAVSTVEHGLELLKLLGDEFAFVYSQMELSLRKRYERAGVIKPGDHPITTHERERLQTAFTKGELRRAIATCWNQGVDFKQLGVLIRADATGADIKSVQLPGRLSRTSDGKDVGTLVDYSDDWCESLHNRSLQRIRTYKKRGWSIARETRRTYDVSK